MNSYMSIYIYIHICIYICHIHIQIYLYTLPHDGPHASVPTCFCFQMPCLSRMHQITYIYIYIYTHTLIDYVYTYIYIYIYIHSDQTSVSHEFCKVAWIWNIIQMLGLVDFRFTNGMLPPTGHPSKSFL